jgi:hypothetical protein
MQHYTESAAVDCPCCGETVEVLVDLSLPLQEYTEDCPVCCRPMILKVANGESGLAEINVRGEND